MPPAETVEEVRVEQQTYARVLDRAAKAGFLILVAGFLAYALGWIPAHVPLERLPELWRLPLQDYLRATDTPTGWGWIVHLPKGEFTSLAGVRATRRPRLRGDLRRGNRRAAAGGVGRADGGPLSVPP